MLFFVVEKPKIRVFSGSFLCGDVCCGPCFCFLVVCVCCAMCISGFFLLRKRRFPFVCVCERGVLRSFAKEIFHVPPPHIPTSKLLLSRWTVQATLPSVSDSSASSSENALGVASRK
jgi:hypothetical protein